MGGLWIGNPALTYAHPAWLTQMARAAPLSLGAASPPKPPRGIEALERAHSVCVRRVSWLTSP